MEMMVKKNKIKYGVVCSHAVQEVQLLLLILRLLWDMFSATRASRSTRSHGGGSSHSGPDAINPNISIFRILVRVVSLLGSVKEW